MLICCINGYQNASMFGMATLTDSEAQSAENWGEKSHTTRHCPNIAEQTRTIQVHFDGRLLNLPEACTT